jgi:hypothetical protein
LRAVLIDDVEKGKLAFGIGSGFLGHAGLVFDQGAAVKENNPRCAPICPARSGVESPREARAADQELSGLDAASVGWRRCWADAAGDAICL